MKMTLEQDYSEVELTLTREELDTILDTIGEDQIENIAVTIKKPAEADNGEEN